MSKIKFVVNSKVGVCPECGGALLIKENRRTGNQFVGCENWPQCNHHGEVPEELKLKALGAQQLPGMEGTS